MKKICGSANTCFVECCHRRPHTTIMSCSDATCGDTKCGPCVDVTTDEEIVAETYEETDPNGIPANEPGAKLDAGKVRVGMMLDQFAHALWAVAEVSTYGVGKYSEGAWLEVPDGEARYSDAEGRHRLKKGMGEEYDAESGLLHDAHKAWNALAQLELKLRKDPSHKETARQKVTKMLLGLGLKPESYLISIEEEEEKLKGEKK